MLYGFILSLFAVAMDCECIDMKALDSGYELFYIMLTYEVLVSGFLLFFFCTKLLSYCTGYSILVLKCLVANWCYFNIIFSLFQTVHAMKLVYTLTKPIDVTRRRVLELLDYAKKREAKKVCTYTYSSCYQKKNTETCSCKAKIFFFLVDE